MAKTITILNTKGGSGKSTTAENVADALALKHKAVLIVDADRQGTITMHFGHNPKLLHERHKTLDFGLFKGVAAADLVLFGEAFTPDLLACYPEKDDDTVILEFYAENLSISPNKKEIIRTPKYPNRSLLLKNLLSTVQENYDYIIIDTPGSMNIVTRNCLAAADGTVIIMPPQRKAVDALPSFLQAYKEVVQTVNPRLHNFGILPTAYKPNKHQNAIIEDIQTHLSAMMPILEPVRSATIFENTSGKGVSAVRAYPKDERTQPYIDVANTIVDYYE